MDRVEFLDKIENIKQWKKGEKRAPHKPLLLLLALGRVHEGGDRLIRFEGDIEVRLRALLDRFGAPRKTQKPEEPYKRLQNDGLWEVPGYGKLRTRADDQPLIGELRKTSGGLPEALHGTLQDDPLLVVEAAQQILHAHFPRSLHDDILDAVGIPEYLLGTRRRSLRLVWERDRTFRSRVLAAYGHRCAVCGFDLRVDDRPLGLEAAHIRWHTCSGPDSVDNGLALCAFHHKALDLGALGLECVDQGAAGGTGAARDPTRMIIVSSKLQGSDPGRRQLLDYAGRPLRPPEKDQDSPDCSFVEWHFAEVFRGPAVHGG